MTEAPWWDFHPTSAPEIRTQSVAVVYDFEARLLGHRYLLCAKDNQPGYTTIPVEG